MFEFEFVSVCGFEFISSHGTATREDFFVDRLSILRQNFQLCFADAKFLRDCSIVIFATTSQASTKDHTDMIIPILSSILYIIITRIQILLLIIYFACEQYYCNNQNAKVLPLQKLSNSNSLSLTTHHLPLEFLTYGIRSFLYAVS